MNTNPCSTVISNFRLKNIKAGRKISFKNYVSVLITPDNPLLLFIFPLYYQIIFTTALLQSTGEDKVSGPISMR